MDAMWRIASLKLLPESRRVHHNPVTEAPGAQRRGPSPRRPASAIMPRSSTTQRVAEGCMWACPPRAPGGGSPRDDPSITFATSSLSTCPQCRTSRPTGCGVTLDQLNPRRMRVNRRNLPWRGRTATPPLISCTILARPRLLPTRSQVASGHPRARLIAAAAVTRTSRRGRRSSRPRMGASPRRGRGTAAAAAPGSPAAGGSSCPA